MEGMKTALLREELAVGFYGYCDNGVFDDHRMTKVFESRKGHLDYRLNRDYIRNGVATIPCRISDYSDVISTYSVKGYETLNPEFIDSA